MEWTEAADCETAEQKALAAAAAGPPEAQEEPAGAGRGIAESQAVVHDTSVDPAADPTEPAAAGQG